ncbi:hypothetical protein GCM10023094_43490 [Rhodococcus olei]|uniref:Uncharacterized protein n=1 Tax=Rhodococcus olei TaxID=2161675 RepID=A0ABP8PIL1_9NOCA
MQATATDPTMIAAPSAAPIPSIPAMSESHIPVAVEPTIAPRPRPVRGKANRRPWVRAAAEHVQRVRREWECYGRAGKVIS